MKSVMPKRDGCYICGYGGYTEEHHIFGGTANRSRSERYGLKVQLCVEHHRGTNGAHGKNGKWVQDYLHEEGQARIEEIWTKEGEKYPRARFIEEFGRSYLDE